MRKASWIAIFAFMALGGCRAGFDTDSTLTGQIDGGPTGDGSGGDASGGDGMGGDASTDVSSDTVLGDPECGNGLVEEGEGCDDENDDPTDGCDSCQVTDGWACSGAPSVCGVDCGDGKVTAPELCDDGGTMDGDGCSKKCKVEEGWLCGTEEPSVCTPDCGDGVVIEGYEECDDDANAPGDGCSADCQLEAGWACSGTPSVCIESCGDGVLQAEAGEECDDSDTDGGDGCDPSCQVEPGWSCPDGPGECKTECGDGAWAPGAEDCDGGLDGVAGCEANCTETPGWTCGGEPGGLSTCEPICGDGIVVAGEEECDDNNPDNGDGCSLSCTVEDGFQCDIDASLGYSVCYGECGDGITLGGEECDDGGQDGIDGCAGCKQQPGWICTVDASSVSTCTPDCGDGVVVGDEECDDANFSAEDGCAGCQVVDDWWCVPAGDDAPSHCCYDPDGDQYGDGPACLGLDCLPLDETAFPGADELCDGLDNNCDGLTDEALSQDCYTGPGGTEGTGQCQGGQSYCVAGEWSSCLNQRLPSAETCNGHDDDCDGDTDEDLGSVYCGIGTCGGTQPACTGNGTVASCPAVQTGPDNNCDGIDNDCDGMIDEGCDCVFVSSGTAKPSPDGTVTNPFGSIQAAIDQADADGKTLVCVAGLPNCGNVGSSNNIYQETVEMADGVSVQGAYVPGSNTRSGSCGVEISTYLTPYTVRFGSDVKSPTTLDEVTVTNAAQANTGNSGDTVRTVLVDNAEGAIITDSVIEANNLPGWPTSYGVEVTQGGELELLATRVYGSDNATNLSVGVHVSDSKLIARVCSSNRITAGRCTNGWNQDLHITSQPVNGNWQNPAPNGRAIVLDNSPGSLVDVTAAHAAASLTAAGVEVTGDATGTRLSRGAFSAYEGATWSTGVYLHDCLGTNPIVVDNHIIASGGPNAGISSGIRASACDVLIADNVRIAGGEEGGGSIESYGVWCSGAADCKLVDNALVEGSMNGLPPVSVAVRCADTSCSEVSGNVLTGRAGVLTKGLWLDGADTFVDRNDITGGCASVESIGIHAEDATSRVQNNFVKGGNCPDTGSPTLFVGLWAEVASGLADLDVHSNTFDGQGSAFGPCTSLGVLLQATGFNNAIPRGFFRNNLMMGGYCPTQAAMGETDGGADPAWLESNHMYAGTLSGAGGTGLYLDEGIGLAGINGIALGTATEVDTANGGSSTSAGDPTINNGNPYSFTASSPLFDAGTTSGMPAYDINGTPRPSIGGPDIGCVEMTP